MAESNFVGSSSFNDTALISRPVNADSESNMYEKHIDADFKRGRSLRLFFEEENISNHLSFDLPLFEDCLEDMSYIRVVEDLYTDGLVLNPSQHCTEILMSHTLDTDRLQNCVNFCRWYMERWATKRMFVMEHEYNVSKDFIEFYQKRVNVLLEYSSELATINSYSKETFSQNDDIFAESTANSQVMGFMVFTDVIKKRHAKLQLLYEGLDSYMKENTNKDIPEKYFVSVESSWADLLPNVFQKTMTYNEAVTHKENMRLEVIAYSSIMDCLEVASSGGFAKSPSSPPSFNYSREVSQIIQSIPEKEQREKITRVLNLAREKARTMHGAGVEKHYTQIVDYIKKELFQGKDWGATKLMEDVQKSDTILSPMAVRLEEIINKYSDNVTKYPELYQFNKFMENILDAHKLYLFENNSAVLSAQQYATSPPLNMVTKRYIIRCIYHNVMKVVFYSSNTHTDTMSDILWTNFFDECTPTVNTGIPVIRNIVLPGDNIRRENNLVRDCESAGKVESISKSWPSFLRFLHRPGPQRGTSKAIMDEVKDGLYGDKGRDHLFVFGMPITPDNEQAALVRLVGDVQFDDLKREDPGMIIKKMIYKLARKRCQAIADITAKTGSEGTAIANSQSSFDYDTIIPLGEYAEYRNEIITKYKDRDFKLGIMFIAEDGDTEVKYAINGVVGLMAENHVRDGKFPHVFGDGRIREPTQEVWMRISGKTGSLNEAEKMSLLRRNERITNYDADSVTKEMLYQVPRGIVLAQGSRTFSYNRTMELMMDRTLASTHFAMQPIVEWSSNLVKGVLFSASFLNGLMLLCEFIITRFTGASTLHLHKIIDHGSRVYNAGSSVNTVISWLVSANTTLMLNNTVWDMMSSSTANWYTAGLMAIVGIIQLGSFYHTYYPKDRKRWKIFDGVKRFLAGWKTSKWYTPIDLITRVMMFASMMQGIHSLTTYFYGATVTAVNMVTKATTPLKYIVGGVEYAWLTHPAGVFVAPSPNRVTSSNNTRGDVTVEINKQWELYANHPLCSPQGAIVNICKDMVEIGQEDFGEKEYITTLKDKNLISEEGIWDKVNKVWAITFGTTTAREDAIEKAANELAVTERLLRNKKTIHGLCESIITNAKEYEQEASKENTSQVNLFSWMGSWAPQRNTSSIDWNNVSKKKELLLRNGELIIELVSLTQLSKKVPMGIYPNMLNSKYGQSYLDLLDMCDVMHNAQGNAIYAALQYNPSVPADKLKSILSGVYVSTQSEMRKIQQENFKKETTESKTIFQYLIDFFNTEKERNSYLQEEEWEAGSKHHPAQRDNIHLEKLLTRTVMFEKKDSVDYTSMPNVCNVPLDSGSLTLILGGEKNAGLITNTMADETKIMNPRIYDYYLQDSGEQRQVMIFGASLEKQTNDALIKEISESMNTFNPLNITSNMTKDEQMDLFVTQTGADTDTARKIRNEAFVKASQQNFEFCVDMNMGRMARDAKERLARSTGRNRAAMVKTCENGNGNTTCYYYEYNTENDDTKAFNETLNEMKNDVHEMIDELRRDDDRKLKEISDEKWHEVMQKFKNGSATNEDLSYFTPTGEMVGWENVINTTAAKEEFDTIWANVEIEQPLGPGKQTVFITPEGDIKTELDESDHISQCERAEVQGGKTVVYECTGKRAYTVSHRGLKKDSNFKKVEITQMFQENKFKEEEEADETVFGLREVPAGTPSMLDVVKATNITTEALGKFSVAATSVFYFSQGDGKLYEASGYTLAYATMYTAALMGGYYWFKNIQVGLPMGKKIRKHHRMVLTDASYGFADKGSRTMIYATVKVTTMAMIVVSQFARTLLYATGAIGGTAANTVGGATGLATTLMTLGIPGSAFMWLGGAGVLGVLTTIFAWRRR